MRSTLNQRTSVKELKMIYLLQIQTRDFGLQLHTEVTASTIQQLQIEAKEMISNNPIVKGMKYLIASYTKNSNGEFESKTIKVGIIAK